MNLIEQKISKLGIQIPITSPPMAALLIPTRILGDRLLVSAQTPKWNNKIMYSGKVGSTHDLEAGQKATRLCALNLIANAKKALDGDLSRIVAVAYVRGYVNVEPDFNKIAEVVNGASQVILDVFGTEIGSHCRTALGATNMPFDATAEVEAEFLIRG